MASHASTLPNTREEVEAWLLNTFNTFDSRDVTVLNKIFSKKGELHFANNPVLKGLDEIRQWFTPNFEVLGHMKHVPILFDKVDEKIWFTTEISYRVKGDPENETITLPGSALATLVTEGEETGKMARFQVFLDNRPVVEKVEAVLKLTAAKESET
ncbi:hypothetical protein CkaCkLH20_03766 [Colletotrichum karsti]|uniref:SnoaL-like domain-containing protein n=1 Tax=Colletotrichum karsti TaxID=1095194 RepID=A0A9P6LN55_9PEZI|nr:uncharacterized protein CkaCkLH20_03766 [Colletotrichum karsti]KAF9878866.1 hypothetical protein CkaCkLH20_03766 [Colletotrichum karsti]